MSPAYLIDSDVIIWHLRGKRQFTDLLCSFGTAQVACSAITTFEVLRGALSKREEVAYEFFDAIRQIPVTPEIAGQAAEYWKRFRRRGIALGNADAIIAATAKVHELTLVTCGAGHYPMRDIKLYRPMPKL